MRQQTRQGCTTVQHALSRLQLTWLQLTWLQLGPYAYGSDVWEDRCLTTNQTCREPRKAEASAPAPFETPLATPLESRRNGMRISSRNSSRSDPTR
ncbi:MAG: hypothetical protein ACI8UD_003675 [Planctomycetota bacterium]|jgi:hypothetical protein